MPALARELGLGQVYVKDESNRLGLPAFKVLGGSYAVHRAVTAHGRPTALVTATDGNHGRALARTGRLLDLPVRVFVPAGVHPVAIAAIEDEGADVVAQARDEAAASGALLVQDTAWPGYEQIPAWIVHGYTTLFGEIDDQLDALGRRPDAVLVPWGWDRWPKRHYTTTGARPAGIDPRWSRWNPTPPPACRPACAAIGSPACPPARRSWRA